MDGTQIIRRASFASTNPKKYGLKFTRITTENIIPYKVFNKIQPEKANIVQGSASTRTKNNKVFYDTTTVVMNEKDEIYEQGLGPLYLKNGDSVYKLKFEKINEKSNQRENVDLSGAFNYILAFYMKDNSKMEVYPTYSRNMSSALGELEFKLSENQVARILVEDIKDYSIKVKNPDGTDYTFYEGKVYSYAKREQEKQEYLNYKRVIADSNRTIAFLNQKIKKLEDTLNEYQLDTQTTTQTETGTVPRKDNLFILEKESQLRPTPDSIAANADNAALNDKIKELEEENIILHTSGLSNKQETLFSQGGNRAILTRKKPSQQ